MNGANLVTRLDPSLPVDGLLGRVRGARRTVAAIAFWGAIALPAVYLPLLAAGIDTPGGLLTFLLLFGIHGLALVGGRRYRR